MVLAPSAFADTWPPQQGDLVLGVQAESGTGSNTNLFFNLGSATDLRDTPNAGLLGNIAAEMTATYGAGWESRTDLYFGVIANFSNAPLSGPSAGGVTNGDPSRTIYASRATASDGGSLAFSGFNQSGLGTVATILGGQYDMLATLTANGNNVATVSSAEPAKFANGWTQYNPFITAGVQGAAYTVIGGGIQNTFNGGGDAKVDIQRILPTTGKGSLVATITIADNGDITASGSAATYRTLTQGTTTGGQIIGHIDGTLYADGSTVTLTAVPGGSAIFGGWTDDASGTVNPLTVTLDANKTIGANFITLTGTWPPAPGDLILGFQAESGTGSNVNLFANLGPATDVRDNPSLGTVAVLGNELSNTYGAGWFSRTDLYFGVIGNFSNAPLTGPSAGGTTDGDPTRTVYVSRPTASDGASLPFSINGSGLGTAATILQGQYDMLATLAEGSNESATVSSAEPAKFANGWSARNPFIASGVQGAAYTVFGGGIQNTFGQGGPAKVDLQRLLPNSGSGSYVATVTIDSGGNVAIGGTATNYFTLNQGAVTGGQINGLINGSTLYAEGSTVTLTAVPTQGGSVFTGWTGDASGSVNPLTVTFDGNKTIGAEFGIDLTDVDNDGPSAFDEINIHGTDPTIANTPPALPPTIAHVSSTTTTGGAEISAYDSGSRNLFVTQGGGLAVLDLTNPASPNPVTTIDFTQAPFNLSGTSVTSVATSNGTVAVAVPDGVDKNNPGTVVFLDASTLNLLGTATVGSLPDMVTFTPDGNKVLTANEGESPDAGGFGTALGTVSIIDVSGGFGSAPVATADFTAFDSQAQRQALWNAGVRLFDAAGGPDFIDNDGDTVTDEPGENLNLPSQDFEPEYIAVAPDSSTAVVVLQEANAIAILDLSTNLFTSVEALGEKDWSGLYADFSDEDGVGGAEVGHLVMGQPVFGLYMPDAIDAFEVGGQTYYITANEGDDRDDFVSDSERLKDGSVDLDDTVFPNEADLKDDASLGRLGISNSYGLRGDTDGDGDIDRILAYGGRSFSIFDSTGSMVYDSGDFIEKTIHSYGFPFFDDGRSDNKGPEPEGVEVGLINGVPKAFVGLERSNAIMMFDLSVPTAPVFEAFLQEAGDESPEGLTFIPASDSPTSQALLVVTNEVSETVTIFSFDVPTFDLTIDATTNGSITGASTGAVPANDTVNLTAVPDPGFSFTGWTGDASGTTNPLAVLMDANKTIGANFAPDATDTDNNGFSDFEESQLAALNRQFNVGDTVFLDLSFLDDSSLRILVSGLPRGLSYDPNTQTITGTILAPGSDNGALIRKLDGRRKAGQIPLVFSIEDYPFLGTYEALIETTGGSPLPAGSVKIVVNKVGSWSGVLQLLGEPAPRRARGTFVNAQAPTQQIVANFVNRRLGDVSVTVDLSTASDLVTGTVSNGNDVRGFRIAKPVRNPGGTVKLSTGLFPDTPGDSVNVPAGTGFLNGTVNNRGIVRMRAILGDSQRTAVSFCLSQTNQGVLWKMPYKRAATMSYIGGIFDIGDLGQASRGGAPAGDPNTGIKWFKEAGIPGERIYPNGFAVQELTGLTSRWIPVPSAVAMAESLGLQFREIDASYVGDADPGLPTKYSLRNRYTLLPIAPFNALVTRVRANRVNGSFGGTIRHPDGNSRVDGVLLQDESFGTTVGAGLIKIPIPGQRGAFRTAGIELEQTP